MRLALHLRAPLPALAERLEDLLLPDTSAVLLVQGEWVSVYAEQLSEDLADITELAAPLSKDFGSVWVSGSLHHHFEDGSLSHSTHQAPSDLPPSADFDPEAALPAQAIRIIKEARKPGLAEFFGRSDDE